MNDFTFMKKMNEEDAYLFKRCIRKMLDTTFIVADKDEKLYDFISSESNQYDVNTYLAAIGYKVVVEERMKVAMLQQADEDVETVGLKRINLYRFDAKQVKLLMVVWLLFLERMGYADPVHITVGDVYVRTDRQMHKRNRKKRQTNAGSSTYINYKRGKKECV